MLFSVFLCWYNCSIETSGWSLVLWARPFVSCLLLRKCLPSCVYSESGSDRSGSFWSCGVFPLRSPLISSKLCPFLILVTWIIAMAVISPYLIAVELVEYSGGLVCEFYWNEVFGEYTSPEKYVVTFLLIYIFMPLALIAIFSIIIFLKPKSLQIPGEKSAITGQQRQLRERNVLKTC